MYFAIEIFPKHDLVIKNISDEDLHEIIEDIPLYKDRRVFYREDQIMITNFQTYTTYYKDEDKRAEMVSKLLASGQYLTKPDFFTSGLSTRASLKNGIIPVLERRKRARI